MPIGACWARADVAEAFKPGDHGSTFGGQPLAAAAARATLAVMEECDVPGSAPRRRARSWRRACPACRAWPACGARACCWRPSWSAPVAKEVTARALAAGLVVNAVTERRHPPGATSARVVGRDRGGRRHPRAGAAGRRTCAADGDRRDPTPPRDRRPDVGRAGRRAGPRPRAAASTGAGRAGNGPGVREALEPHPERHRDGRRAAGRPPDQHPWRRGGARDEGDRRGHRPHTGLLPRRHRRPGEGPHRPRAHGGRAGRRRPAGAGGQPALRSGPSLPGPGRPAHDGGAVRRAAGPDARLGR